MESVLTRAWRLVWSAARGFAARVWGRVKAFAAIVSNIYKRVFMPSLHLPAYRFLYGLWHLAGVLARIAATAAVIAVCSLAVAATYAALYVAHVMDPVPLVVLEEFDPKLTTIFYARSPENPEQWLAVESVSGEENRVWASYGEIPEYIKQAFVAIEDKRYWEHEGVDWKRTVSAFANMFLSMKNNFGGSTITQQLIKNITKNDDVTVQRKFQEIFQALEFEQRYSKERILEYYLNTIYLGESCNGVRTAAAEYFGKELADLTLAECASIVGITNNPYMYDPYINPEKNKQRQEIILREMYRQGMINEGEYSRAVDQKLVFARGVDGREVKVRSWYVEETMRHLVTEMSERFGYGEYIAEQYIFGAGLSVYLEMDINAQAIMDGVWYNPDNWPKGRDPEPAQCTMAIMDLSDGSVRALIGSRFPKEANKLNNMATMTYRQPGSSIKPLATYSPSFELGGLTPYSTVLDAPFSYDEEKERYWPKNAPETYAGRINVITAITESKNTAAVRFMDILTPAVSRRFVIDRFHLSRIQDTLSANGLLDDLSSMALGGLTNGVSVIEMTAAYATFPNGGTYTHPRYYSEVRDKYGELLMDSVPLREAALKPVTAFYAVTCLRNAVAVGTGSQAKFGSWPVAGKTGTTDANYDRWFCGFTPYYAAAAWFGYEIPRSLEGYSGNPALQMWKQVMEPLHEGLTVTEYVLPQGLTQARYCRDSGNAPGPYCDLDPRGARTAQGVFAEEQVPVRTCTIHAPVEVCGVSGKLATPSCPAATRYRVALLADTEARVLPDAGITLVDEQYTLRYYGVAAYEPDDPELHTHAPRQSADFYNTFCAERHQAPPSEPPEPPEPPPSEPGTEPPDAADALAAR